MSERDNLKIVEQMYADFGQGNISGVLDAMTDDVIWKQPDLGPPPFAGSIHGRKQFSEWFGQMDAISEVEAFEPRELIARGDKVVVLGNYRFRSTSTGKVWDSDWAMVWTFRGSKIAEGQILEDTLAQALALNYVHS